VECVVLRKAPTPEGARFSAGYVVDIGITKPALVPRSQVALRPNATSRAGVNIGQGWAELPVGTVLEGEIMSIDETDVNVSLTRPQKRVAWQRVGQLADLDVSVEAKVLRLNEAGATLDIEGLPAFMPWSHWAVPPGERSSKLHGTRLDVKFLEVERGRRRLVVSNRRVRLDAATSELEPGNVVEGTVKKLKSYGAVVALDSGLEGLLHVSQISQVFVQNVSDVFQLADPVRCVVIKVDADDGSISLSTKMLEGKPGEMVGNASAVFARAAAAAAAQDEAAADGSNGDA